METLSNTNDGSRWASFAPLPLVELVRGSTIEKGGDWAKWGQLGSFSDRGVACNGQGALVGERGDWAKWGQLGSFLIPLIGRVRGSLTREREDWAEWEQLGSFLNPPVWHVLGSPIGEREDWAKWRQLGSFSLLEIGEGVHGRTFRGSSARSQDVDDSFSGTSAQRDRGACAAANGESVSGAASNLGLFSEAGTQAPGTKPARIRGRSLGYAGGLQSHQSKRSNRR